MVYKSTVIIIIFIINGHIKLVFCQHCLYSAQVVVCC